MYDTIGFRLQQYKAVSRMNLAASEGPHLCYCCFDVCHSAGEIRASHVVVMATLGVRPLQASWELLWDCGGAR